MRKLDALVAAGGAAPSTNEVGDEDEQDGAGESAANHNGHHITRREKSRVLKKWKLIN
jgi:hypothetical protein